MIDLLKEFLAQPFVKKFVLDALETGIAAIVALNIVFPGSIEEAKSLAVTVGIALAGAILAAARRQLPDIIAWLKAKLGF